MKTKASISFKSDCFIISFSAQYLLITLNPSGATERNGFNYLNVGAGIVGYF